MKNRKTKDNKVDTSRKKGLNMDPFYTVLFVLVYMDTFVFLKCIYDRMSDKSFNIALFVVSGLLLADLSIIFFRGVNKKERKCLGLLLLKLLVAVPALLRNSIKCMTKKNKRHNIIQFALMVSGIFSATLGFLVGFGRIWKEGGYPSRFFLYY